MAEWARDIWKYDGSRYVYNIWFFVSVCECICMAVHMCIYIYTHMCIYIHTHQISTDDHLLQTVPSRNSRCLVTFILPLFRESPSCLSADLPGRNPHFKHGFFNFPPFQQSLDFLQKIHENPPRSSGWWLSHPSEK